MGDKVPAQLVNSWNDTVGMQNALSDAAHAGEVAYFRKDNYVLEDELVVTHRQRVAGSGYNTVIVPAPGKPAFNCKGQGWEIEHLRIRGQTTGARPTIASHGILCDASNNTASGFYEHCSLHDVILEYMKGYSFKALHGFRESWFERIISRACGDIDVPAVHFESFAGDADQINYVKIDKIEIIQFFGHGLVFRSDQGSNARTGCYGNSIKNSVIHGGDETFFPVEGANGLVLDGVSDTVVDDLNVSNIEKNSACVYVSSPSAFKSSRCTLEKLILGGVHGPSATIDPSQTGGLGVYSDLADQCWFDISRAGLSKAYELTANSNRCGISLRQSGKDITDGTNAGVNNIAEPIKRLPFALGGNRLTGVGTAGTSALIGFGALGSVNQPGIYMTDSDPNNRVKAGIGSICLKRTGGGTTTLFVKESGAGTDTGWVGK